MFVHLKTLCGIRPGKNKYKIPNKNSSNCSRTKDVIIIIVIGNPAKILSYTKISIPFKLATLKSEPD